MATMWTLIIKNPSIDTDVMVEDLGINIPFATSITMSDQFTYEELAKSDDLRGFVNVGTLIVNNGTRDLTETEGHEHLVVSKLFNNYGIDRWSSPVMYRCECVCATVDRDTNIPSPVNEDTVYADSTTSSYWYYYNNTWTEAETWMDGDRIIDLSDPNEAIFRYVDNAWETLGNPSEGAGRATTAVFVAERFDRSEKLFTYDTHNGRWRRHAAGTLQEIYEAGNVINVGNDGPIIINATSTTNPPITLVDQNSFPTTNIEDGSLVVVGGDLFVYNEERSKWLSVNKDTVTFGRLGSSKGQYLNHFAGNMPSNNSGLKIEVKSCLISVYAQLDANVLTGETCTIHVRKNKSLTNIASISIPAGSSGAIDLTINVNVSAGDYLQAFVDASVAIKDPTLTVKFAETN